MSSKMSAASCLMLAASVACSPAPRREGSRWTLAEQARSLPLEERLVEQIYRALDAAKHSGTDPGISRYQVRSATLVEYQGKEQVILGGNTEYALPEAIHGETSLMNHAINLLGAGAARQSVRFIAFYSQECGGGRSCGDCRDYLMATTRYQELWIACGQASDYTVQLHRFADGLVPEETFPAVSADAIPLTTQELRQLVSSAREARRGGVALFTPEERHLGVAALSSSGKIYRAAGADDAAFHYRFPVGGALQQAATERDYFLKAVLVAGEPGTMPRLSYRDRQYGFEFSSFNRKRGKPPIQLILVDNQEGYRLTSFEEALPYAFRTEDFMPEALARFLEMRARN